MGKPMKIDFVSDVSCPWCIIDLRALEEALGRLGDLVEADITFQPFELNPSMPPQGQNIVEHIAQKYGSSPEQSAHSREMIRTRAAELGFRMQVSEESRIYNTFDAHRLLHWAKLQGRQNQLKNGLFKAYFTEGLDPSKHDVLVGAADAAGLDADQARDVLTSGRYADAVREEERLWQSRGISAVPTVVINERYLIFGGQPVEEFEKALRAISVEDAATS